MTELLLRMYLPKPNIYGFRDIQGERHNRLVVLGYAGPAKGGSRWWCRCDCGNVSRVNVTKLLIGATKSCGCLKDENTGNRHRTHGMRRHPLYNTWAKMRSRCDNAADPAYPRYGGRGISVTASWQGPDGFPNFVADVGERPSRSHSIDRINNDGDYEPGNVRWATPKQQANNRRNS